MVLLKQSRTQIEVRYLHLIIKITKYNGLLENPFQNELLWVINLLGNLVFNIVILRVLELI